MAYPGTIKTKNESLNNDDKQEMGNDAEVVPSNEEWSKLVSHEMSLSTPIFEDIVQIDYYLATAAGQTNDGILENCVTIFTCRTKVISQTGFSIQL